MSEKEQNSNRPESKKGLSATQIILLVGIILLLAVVTVFGVIIYRSMNAPEPETASGNYVVDESNFDEISREMKEKVADNMFEVQMNMDWKFPNPSEASTNAYVANAKSNSRPFFIEVSLSDTEEIIFTSTVLPVGNAFKEIVLDKKDLSPGTYPAVCKYNFLDETGGIKSSVNFEITIKIG